jgi:dTDP-4-dehydrorhamnose 3,5-epimerase-like enzyme
MREVDVKVTIRESIVDRDERGFRAQPIEDGLVRFVSNMHLVSLVPGAVRGNHYHERHVEYLCLIGGRVRFRAVDAETGETIDTVLEGSTAPVVSVPPRVTHAVKNIGAETCHLLCYSRVGSGSWQGDVTRRIILE